MREGSSQSHDAFNNGSSFPENNSEGLVEEALSVLLDEWFDTIKSGHLEKTKSLYYEQLRVRCINIDITTRDQWSYTALHWACQKGHLLICKFLIQNGSRTDKKAQKVPWTPMLLAARYGHTDVVRYLIDVCHVNINEQIDCDSRYTALHYSCHHGHVEIVKLLLSYDAIDPSLTSGHGLRAIHTAANNCQVECLRAIIVSGKENINARHDSEWAYTALHWACQENHLPVVKLLLESGADLYLLCGRQPLTAVQIAKKSGHISIVNYIEQFELEQRSRYNFRVFCEYPLGTKRYLHMVNVKTVSDLKQRLFTHFVLEGMTTGAIHQNIADYMFEFYISDFEDYALMEENNPEEMPIFQYLNGNNVRIRITKQRSGDINIRDTNIETDQPAFEQFNNADLVHSFSSESLASTPSDGRDIQCTLLRTTNQCKYSTVKQLNKFEALVSDDANKVKHVRQYKCSTIDQINSIMNLFMQRNMAWSQNCHLCKYENLYLTNEESDDRLARKRTTEVTYLQANISSPRSDGVSNGRDSSSFSHWPPFSSAFITVNLVREEYSLGNMEQFLAIRKRTTGISVEMSIHFMKQVCSAVKSLHDIGCYHGSIKPSIIYFADSKFNSLVLDQMVTHNSAGFGDVEDSTDYDEEALAYSSPECVMGDNSSPSSASDVWSIGCLFVELLGISLDAKQLYTEALINPSYLYQISKELAQKHVDYHQIQPLSQLVCSMLAREPTDRPVIATVLTQLELFLGDSHEKINL